MWKNTILKKRNPARWVATSYVIFGVLWILFSDNLVAMLVSDPVSLTRVQTYKGWFFVLGSGVLIYYIVSRVVYDLRKARYSIAEKEQLQKDFLNRHVQPLWQTDIYGNCVFSNRKWHEFTGYVLSEEKPLPFIDIVHEDDKAHCIEKFSRGLISQQAFTLEYRILSKNKTYHWVLNSCIPHYDVGGAFLGLIGVLYDVQEKKELEERYKENSRRYGYLFANNPHPMLVYDLRDLRILEANKAALALYGYPEKEFLSLALLDLMPATAISSFMEHLAEELPSFHRSSGWMHKKKDGSVFDAELTTHSLPSQNGRSSRLVIVRDVTDQIRAFKGLKEGERRFRAIFEHSPYAALILNKELIITNANPKAQEILGLESNSRHSLEEFLATDSTELMMSDLKTLFEGAPIVGEVNLMRKSGKVFRAEYHGVSFPEDNTMKAYFSFNDVDEKYRMQVDLQASERLNATLVSNLPGMAYRCRFDDAWTMLFISYGVEKLTGYTPSDLIYNMKISYLELIHPEDRDKARSSITQAIEQDRMFEVQYRIVTRQNEVKWVWEQARGIRNKLGEVQYIEGFIMNISREKEAIDRVVFQSKFLGLIIDNIPFPLFYKNTMGLYTGCNQAFCDYLGRTKEQIIGKSVFDIFEESQAGVFYQKDQELFGSGTRQVYETQIVFPDGRHMDAVFHKAVFYDDQNRQLGIIGIYFDITQRVEAERVIKKQLEELSRANSELERFSYTVSHDLRSPLVTIQGFLGLLQEDLQDGRQEDVQDSIDRIGNATRKMQQLLEDLLELSRVGRIVNPYEKFSMTLAASEARELLFGLISEKKGEVTIQENMPEVYADKARCRELFQNLIENALKFSSPLRTPKIHIHCRTHGQEIVFCVRDNGIGIPKAFHEKIFGLFNKLDNSSPGTGLGLSLVKHILDNHNGRIWVESDGNNKGTEFCFTLNTENSKTENS